MRKHYIDNLRILVIFLLFPVHTFMIWNEFGDKFYIWEVENKLLSTLIVVVNPWFMSMLFAFAGIGAKYSLKKRSVKEFIKERVEKLLIPFICGVILLVPIQTLYARKFFFDYQGGYFKNLKYFFTHITDLSGYDGGFTPGHLWFILFLFMISVLSLVIIHFLPHDKVDKKISKINIWLIIAMFIPVCLMYYLGNFGGYSLGKCLSLYLLGYYILSNDDIILILEKHIKLLAIIYVIAEIVLLVAYYRVSYYGDILVNFVGWMGILVLPVIGKKYLNTSSKFTKYFNAASFPIYILHQSILVVLAYYVLKEINHMALQISIIMFGSFMFSILYYEILRKISYLREMFGIKSKTMKSKY